MMVSKSGTNSLPAAHPQNANKGNSIDYRDFGFCLLWTEASKIFVKTRQNSNLAIV